MVNYYCVVKLVFNRLAILTGNVRSTVIVY